jgi:hypothetical protein
MEKGNDNVEVYTRTEIKFMTHFQIVIPIFNFHFFNFIPFHIHHIRYALGFRLKEASILIT